jgi:hypothetical protein
MTSQDSNVVVCCRIRPPNKNELANPEFSVAVQVLNQHNLELDTSSVKEQNIPTKSTFPFDQVFPSASSQVAVAAIQ